MANNKAFKVKNGLELGAISDTITDTAVDVFIYDTSKDSDGGAWRKRTQNTSWYNETLNTSVRGSRKEFPAVAVIVVESTQLTIYDGDDPDLPMWMVFNPNKYGYIYKGDSDVMTSAVMANGQLFTGANGALGGASWVDFIGDRSIQSIIYTSSSIKYFVNLPITGRNNLGSNRRVEKGPGHPISGDKMQLANRVINDVAVAVLPNAYVDPTTGLPVPTFALATDSGMAVINSNGVTTGSSYTNAFSHIVANKDGFAFAFNSFENFGVVSYDRITTPAWSSDISNIYYGGSGGMSPLAQSHSSSYAIDALAGYSQGNNLGVTNWDWELPAKGYYIKLFNYTTSSYNTGWMNGDIKLATLSDTDDTNVTGSELVTNGTFDSDTAWVKGTNWTISGGVASHTSTAGYLEQTLSMSVGQRVTITMTITGSAVILGNGTSIASSNITLPVGTSSVTGTVISSNLSLYMSGSGTVDNVSVRLAEEDRSINDNGLQVFGTVNKGAVATGADLVGYSNFSSSNYLEQPYNSDLDFGTNDFCIMGWIKVNGSDTHQCVMQRNSSTAGAGFLIEYRYDSDTVLLQTDNGTSVSNLFAQSNSVPSNAWVHVCAVITQSGEKPYWFINGVQNNTTDWTGIARDVDNASAFLRIGEKINESRPLDGYLALWRISATAPTPEQIRKIYEDEKMLFQDNAQATIYGSSDAVTALAYDEGTDLLHVGTSSGRSVFQGLRRVDNTTTAVTAAVSASNGLVADE